MKSRKLISFMALAFAALIGCSNDDTTSQPDWSLITPPDEVGTTDAPAECNNIVVAHRGGSTEAGSAYPDNSLASLNYAITLGCYASECDIYWTKDNQVVVAHADSNCCINGLHPWEATLSELRAAGRLTNGEQLPSLEDFIDAVMQPGNCTRLWLDIKNITSPSTLTQYPISACRRACEIITEKGAKNYVEFICTSNKTVMASSVLAANSADIPIAWMSNSAAKTYASNGYPWANLSTEYIYKNGVNVGTRTISEFKQAGIELSVFNADEQVDMQYYAAQASNMKAICTNYPKRLLSLMGKL